MNLVIIVRARKMPRVSKSRLSESFAVEIDGFRYVIETLDPRFRGLDPQLDWHGVAAMLANEVHVHIHTATSITFIHTGEQQSL